MEVRLVFRNFPHGERAFNTVLEAGELGTSLHQAVGLLYAAGFLPGLRNVTGVWLGSTRLAPGDQVRDDEILHDPTGARQRIAPLGPVRGRLALQVDGEWSGAPAPTLREALGRDERLLPLTLPSPVNAHLVLPPKMIEVPTRRFVFRHAAHQSGDRYAIALALKILPWLRIDIVWDDRYYPTAYRERGLVAPPLLMKKKAFDMARFYLDCGIEPFRISISEVADAEQAVSRSRMEEACLLASDATRIVASCISELGIETFRRQLAIPTLTGSVSRQRQLHVRRLVELLTADTRGDDHPVVLIFLRSTGGLPGGAHPELDTRKLMVRQIVEYLSMQQPAPHIYLVGDRLFKRLQPGKGKTWKSKVRDMMQWWNVASNEQVPPLSLQEQLYGYHYLHQRLGNRLTMFGMRSGMLEAPAFLGIETVYIDYVFVSKEGKTTGSAGFERMLVLAGTPRGGRFDLGDEQGFKGIKIPNYHIFGARPVEMIANALTGDPKRAHLFVEGCRQARRVLKNVKPQGTAVSAIYNKVFVGGAKKVFRGPNALLNAFEGVVAVTVNGKEDERMAGELLTTLNSTIVDVEIIIDPAQLSDLRALIYNRKRDPYAPSLQIVGRNYSFEPRKKGKTPLDPLILQLSSVIAKLAKIVEEQSDFFGDCETSKLRKPGKKASPRLQLREQLAATYVTIENAGGGNCLFLAIAQALPDVGPLVLRSEQLRRMAVSFMATFFDAVTWWGSPQKKKNYLVYMQQDGAWGGDFEIAALSLHLGRTIVVHSVEFDAPVTYNAGQRETIELYHNGGHYELMRKR